jgi:hypothetical protein
MSQAATTDATTVFESILVAVVAWYFGARS